MTGQSAAAEPHGADAVRRFLERREVSHEVIEHATYSAAAEARAVGADLEATAKTVVLRDRGGYRLAVIPPASALTVRAL